jgi:cation diffusion facilitator family transporter
MARAPAKKETPAARARRQEILRVTLVGSVVDLALGVAKIFYGFVAQSQALIADGIHSLSDLFTDFFVIYAAVHGSQEADEEHPYGHKRFETAVTVMLGIALMAVAVGIGYDAARRLFSPERLLHPGMPALVVAVISIVSKEIIYHYSIRIAKKYRSEMLRANAWHSRSDAISSVIVVIGVLGSMAGLDYLDAIAAIGVALMVVKIGWDLTWNNLRELVDTGLEAERVEAIRRAIMAVDGVTDTHMLRTRRMGGDALADVHIQVHPNISVSEGHHISETVRKRLIRQIEELTDVTVHIDTEDDQAAQRSIALPLRSKILAHAMDLFHHIKESNEIEQITVHYLDGKAQLELLLPLDRAANTAAARKLAARFQDAIRDDAMISRVEVRFG